MNKILSARPLSALIIHSQAFERNCRGVVNASIEALADATPLRLPLLPFRMNQQSPSKHLQQMGTVDPETKSLNSPFAEVMSIKIVVLIFGSTCRPVGS